MQEENKKEPMVDIDTSGPGADVELPEEKPENEVETKEESSPSTPAAETTKVEASDEKPGMDKTEQKEELQDYSKDVQRRIAKLTRKWREAERQKDEAVHFARIQKYKAEDLSKKYETLESSSLKSREEKLKTTLDAAKIKLASARDSGDINLEFDAHRELANAGYEEGRLKELKSIAESKPQQVRSDPRMPAQFDQAIDPRAEEWANKNKWFGADKPMTYTAFDIHKTLVEEEGYDPQSNEYYDEINKRIRLDFPHKFDTTNTNSTKPTQTVASARRSVNNYGRKTVRLTPSQVSIAKKLGVPLEEYARQLKITEGV